MKRLLAALLTLSVLFSTVVTGAVPAAAAQADDDASKYVTLDGEWHYKLYRTYSQMFQYFPYMPALSQGNWTDAEAAVLPDKADWESWDTYPMPYDDPETGGLLTNDISPTWSESWVVREFDLPEDFTENDEVTLLLGIIDDNDVVYINGQAVAASGFANGNGEAIIDVPATGGFNYTAEDPADQVKWVKSYWEIQREYTIPTDVLNLGGTNEIAIRLYNNNSNGGFYAGNLYAICGNDLAVRALKGLPTEVVESEEVAAAVAAQVEAIEAHDIDAFAATVAENYHNDADTKADRVAAVAAKFEQVADYTVDVVDANAAIYLDENGNYWYSAERTFCIAGSYTESRQIELCFAISGGEALEIGNWNRCYGTSYASELFGEELTYSVYLPPSYYETDDEYPVVWLLHGRASSSTSYRDVDNIGAFMDELIYEGEIAEMVVIMPDSGKYAFYRDSELTPGDKDNSGPWATQLTEELRGVVADGYRVLTDAEFNGLTGNSMGGYGSMVIGTSNPDLYSSIGVHMGYLPEDALESLKALSEAELADYDFYLDCGLQDQTVGTAGTIAVHEYLGSVGKDHGYDLRDGSHTSAFYMSGMADSMKMHSDHFLANGLLDEPVEDPSMYVELDGQWHYKLYRTYSQMFQYFPYMPALSLGKWTDAEAAVLPDKADWESWDTYPMPYDDPETGGLLTNEISPTWSEAWVVREFDLPEDFTENDEVTLLLGIIDDNDVVYINGQAVAASGFANGNGETVIDVPETGGFNYTAEDPADQVKWVKSYWEIQREYTIPAEVLNQGGTNEIAIRLYNNNSFGGFYAGNLYAICGNDLAVRALKGLPTELVDAPAVEKAVARQNAALAEEDVTAYYVTVSPNYHNDAADKSAKMDEVEALMDAYDNIAVEDKNAAVYLDDEGNYWYSAQRTVTAGEEVLSAGPVELCFEIVKGGAREIGNRSRCYGTSYSSGLFGEELTYSVYLPPSYYETDDEYPVVWLLHGRASSSTSYRDVDDIGAFMDDLIESGQVMEMVVVMPDSGKYAFYRDSELTPGDKDNSGPWATQLTQELRELIADEYRVLTKAEFNGLTGNSMGGYGSMVIGTSNPDLYSSIAVHMGYLPEDALESLKSLSEAELADYDFYLDCGLQDTTVGTSGTIAVHEYLESVEKEHGYDLRDGGHNSAFYMSGMADSMKMHSDHFKANDADKAGSVVVKPSKPVEPDEPAEPVDPSEDYVDLDENAWYAEAVDYVISEGLMTGISVDEFAPNGQVTRAAMVQILWAMAGKPVVNYLMDFEDVSQDAWYAEAVRWAVSEGIASGVAEKVFAPDAAITREQLAVMLYRVEQKSGGGFTGLWMFNLDYADADAISEWAYEAMCWCTMKGVLSGRDDGTLDPQGTAARSECAQMLMKYASL